MVEIYCHGKNHVRKGLCEECSALLNYAYQRLDHCKFLDKPSVPRAERGEKKPTCKKVAIKREQRKTRLPLPSVSKLDHRSSVPSIAISWT